MNNNLTGYPSIDRPWLKYYDEEAINAKLTTDSIYEYLYKSNQDNLDGVAINYMDRKITYSELFRNIELSAKAFHGYGIGKGDVVVGIAPSFPEVIYSFYAVNKLGGISDYFDPRTEPEIVAEELKKAKPKAIIIFEDFYGKFVDMIDELKIPLTIIVSARDSLPAIPKILMSLKPKKKCRGIAYKNFIIKHKNAPVVRTVTDISDEVALMEHTGGTTGVQKAVCLTNNNVNSVVEQYKFGGLMGDSDYSKESWVGVGFPFIAYAAICSQHLPLSFGIVIVLCFSVNADEIMKLVLKKKINHMANTPLLWKEILNKDLSSGYSLDFLINPTVGADTLNIEDEEKINNYLLKKNFKKPICKGYGMTETSSGVSVTSSAINKIGSVGIPFTHTIVSIFNHDNGEELKYGEKGEICISGPSVMKGYFENQGATDEVLRLHKDGRYWMHSGDIGYMDEDGFIFISGRLKRMIINHHGFKIFAPEIEKALSKHANIEKCCVVGAPDLTYNVGRIAVVFVIAKDGTAIPEEELDKLCLENCPEYYKPEKYIFVDKFPYTSASKVDYRKLEEMAENL